MIPRLYIFAKAPRLGKAKTRLAADIGQEAALRLYRAMMCAVINNVQIHVIKTGDVKSSHRWKTILAAADPETVGHVPEWEGLEQIPQVEGSLSPRLAEVFKGEGRIIVIGTDCPQVRASDISDALCALETHDAVFGPADDGGFWLIGMNGPVNPKVFESVRWSHTDTLSDIKSNIDGSVYILRTLIDVDDLAALNAVKALDSSWLPPQD